MAHANTPLSPALVTNPSGSASANASSSGAVSAWLATVTVTAMLSAGVNTIRSNCKSSAMGSTGVMVTIVGGAASGAVGSSGSGGIVWLSGVSTAPGEEFGGAANTGSVSASDGSKREPTRSKRTPTAKTFLPKVWGGKHSCAPGSVRKGVL